MSKGHFVPRGVTMSYLEFSLSNKGGKISFSCNILYWFFFLGGGTFIVKLSYNNITIFH